MYNFNIAFQSRGAWERGYRLAMSVVNYTPELATAMYCSTGIVFTNYYGILITFKCVYNIRYNSMNNTGLQFLDMSFVRKSIVASAVRGYHSPWAFPRSKHVLERYDNYGFNLPGC